jgi:hypothetical protein
LQGVRLYSIDGCAVQLVMMAAVQSVVVNSTRSTTGEVKGGYSTAKRNQTHSA